MPKGHPVPFMLVLILYHWSRQAASATEQREAGALKEAVVRTEGGSVPRSTFHADVALPA